MRSIVVDTNVIVSAALSGTGKPAEIVRLISTGKLCLHFSEAILAEYTEVLSRSKFKISPEIQADIIMTIQDNGVMVSPATSTIPLPDGTDRKFYDAAREAGATLITGNTKHFPMEPFVVNPAQFLASIETDS